MDEHAFPPTGFAVALARLHVTFGGSGGIMTTAGPEMPIHVVPRPRLGARLLGVGSGVTG